MTTTAHEDQITIGTQTIEPVRQPYSTEAILRQNVADLEVALRTQTERAESAEAELEKLAKQEPVTYVFDHNGYAINGKHIEIADALPTGMDLYAAPAPAPHKGATHCDDCGLTWLDDGLNPLRCPYCKDAVPAPAVPAEWRAVMAELLANDGSDGCRYDANKWLAARDKARALLQSAEVQAVDKWQLTPATTHPVDRKAGEVRHD